MRLGLALLALTCAASTQRASAQSVELSPNFGTWDPLAPEGLFLAASGFDDWTTSSTIDGETFEGGGVCSAAYYSGAGASGVSQGPPGVIDVAIAYHNDILSSACVSPPTGRAASVAATTPFQVARRDGSAFGPTEDVPVIVNYAMSLTASGAAAARGRVEVRVLGAFGVYLRGDFVDCYSGPAARPLNRPVDPNDGSQGRYVGYHFGGQGLRCSDSQQGRRGTWGSLRLSYRPGAGERLEVHTSGMALGAIDSRCDAVSALVLPPPNGFVLPVCPASSGMSTRYDCSSSVLDGEAQAIVDPYIEIDPAFADPSAFEVTTTVGLGEPTLVPHVARPIDLDGDGFYMLDECDDLHASAHPGAPELCGDEVDNDCDGWLDDEDIDCGCADEDADAICDTVDNCPAVDNADLTDSDHDGIGDACDVCPNAPEDDSDRDGHCDDLDNCPGDANASQEDGDGDGVGDLCDACPSLVGGDPDFDGICEGDVCPNATDPLQTDSDHDGVGDACDACPNDPANDPDHDFVCQGVDNCAAVANNDQANADGDSAGDACDDDDDDDGVPDVADACPRDFELTQLDSDGDGDGDACDDDDDDDGLDDVVEQRLQSNPLDPDSDGDFIGDGEEAGPIVFWWDVARDSDHDHVADLLDGDSDGDGLSDRIEAGDEDLATPALDRDHNGVPDYRDVDADGDGVLVAVDNCPTVANPSQSDLDSDGLGDACDDTDDDQDHDGTPDGIDTCPTVPNDPWDDFDGDGLGDPCDPDDDDDGVADEDDLCPHDAMSDAGDLDDDGIGDLCDEDRDGDGVPNGVEVELGLDPDDPDIDGDGILDGDELTPPRDPNEPDEACDACFQMGCDECPSCEGCESCGECLEEPHWSLPDSDGDGVPDVFDPAGDTAVTPTTVTDGYTIGMDQTLVVGAANGVLANDTPHDVALTAVLDVAPAHGTLLLASDGSFRYTPAACAQGSDSFMYHAEAAGRAGAPATVTLSVTRVAPSFELSLSSVDVAEGEAAPVTVERRGDCAGAVKVTCYTQANSAGTADFVNHSTVLTFAAGVSSLVCPLQTLNDSAVEASESFYLRLKSQSTGTTLGRQRVTVATIGDDDRGGRFELEPLTSSVSESAGQLEVAVIRRDASANAGRVSWTIAGGSAGAADYALRPGETRVLDFAAGETRKTFTVLVTPDALVEGNESFRLGLASPSVGSTLGDVRNAVVHILDDDDAGVFDFAAATSEVAEGAGQVVVEVVRSDATAGTSATVTWSSAAGSAGADDYTLLPGESRKLVFGAGETRKQLVVAVNDDSLAEGYESFRLTLSAPSAGSRLGGQRSAFVHIADDDAAPVVSLATGIVRTSEGSGTVVVHIVRDASALAGIVTLKMASSIATSPADFTATTAMVVAFAAGQSDATVVIPIVEDELVEGDETFTLTLASPVGGILGTQQRAVVVILDND